MKKAIFKKFYIDFFVPLRFKTNKVKIDNYLKDTCKIWHYTSCGKAALYHCMKSLGFTDGDYILVPNYICNSILYAVRKLKLNYVVYDISADDLNADLPDIDNKLCQYPQIKGVLVASMYGNPAALPKIEKLCKERGKYLIDDAAQSWGAKVDNKYVGTFGDAGFFSFSPGKATPGHLGAFFWTSNKDYVIKYRNNYIFHKLSYLDFYLNRYQRYQYAYIRFFFKPLTVFKALFFKYTNFYQDGLNSFEEPILSGILEANRKQSFRTETAQEVKKNIDEDLMQLITKGDPGTNNHKLVIKFKNEQFAQNFIKFCGDKSVYAKRGYTLLEKDGETPTCTRIERSIVELPIEEDVVKRRYLLEMLKEFNIQQKKMGNNHKG